MYQRNVTRITSIHLLGFQIPPSIKWLVCFLLFLIYCVTLCGNLLIITLVSYSKSLHSPMYFFLSQLAVYDLLLITDIVPGTINSFLAADTILSFSECLAQFYFFVITGSSECLLLTAMSWDRYLAICKPLHYALIMNNKACWTLVIVCWILGIFAATIYNLTILQLLFCGPNIINHFFCDLDPILRLSCSDTTNAQLEIFALGFIYVLLPVVIILVSYSYIIVTIFKIPSITGRKKTFSTCSSHMAVVSIYYGSVVCNYFVPSSGQTQTIIKFLPLLYTVGTPMVNPIIYSLRNKELKKAAGKLINNFLGLHFKKCGIIFCL